MKRDTDLVRIIRLELENARTTVVGMNRDERARLQPYLKNTSINAASAAEGFATKLSLKALNG